MGIQMSEEYQWEVMQKENPFSAALVAVIQVYCE